MSAMVPASVLALPQFGADVPMSYTIPGVDAMTIPLTIALLEAGVISDAMLRAPRNALLTEVFGETEKQLCERALAHWWTRLIRANSCKFFRWGLEVMQLDTDGAYDRDTTAWFCFGRTGDTIPRFALGRGIERLERVLDGFGQTVLAVLREALRLLPDSFTPWMALGLAEWMHWDDSENDDELIANYANERDIAVEAVKEGDVLTRAIFFNEVPRWACAPQQVVTRDAIVAAGTGKFEQSVIAACDELHALVTRPEFVLRPDDKGSYRCGRDTVDAAVVLLWKDNGVVGQVIDDYLNDLGRTGEYCEYIDTNPVTMTADGIKEFQIKTEQALQVAVLTEKLILLIGEKL